jgi:hypothetical protein
VILAAGVLAVLAIAGLIALVAGSGGGARHANGGAPAVPPAALQPAAPAKGLAIGLTESNADLLAPPSSDVPSPPGPFAEWRALLSALHPAYLRLVVDWAKLQPSPNGPAQLNAAVDGCLRGIPPCGVYAGLRDELRAIAAQQRAQGGFEPVIVIDGAPDWAAAAPSGCERPRTPDLSRPIRPAAIGAYRALIASILAVGRAEGVALRWWSAWNEPNHPFFLSPQRAACATASPPLAPAIYSELARAMAQQLRADGGQHRMLMGELAGFTAALPRAASIAEFVAALPSDVLCLGSVWSVHAYARRGPATAAAGPVGELEDALNRRGGCAAKARLWVTETGAGAAHAGTPRPPGAADAQAGCRALDVALLRWYRDPRVDAAFQYTFREDNLFPVGLSDSGLSRLYPTYWLLRAWAGSRPVSAPPPALPAQCA